MLKVQRLKVEVYFHLLVATEGFAGLHYKAILGTQGELVSNTNPV